MCVYEYVRERSTSSSSGSRIQSDMMETLFASRGRGDSVAVSGATSLSMKISFKSVVPSP